MSSSNPSGSGTRPTTDGGVDNIGAAEAFSTRKNALGEPVSGPAPNERLRDKASDAEAAEQDDSVPLSLRGDQHAEPNTEPGTDLDTEPGTEPTTEPRTEPHIEPSTEPKARADTGPDAKASPEPLSPTLSR